MTLDLCPGGERERAAGGQKCKDECDPAGKVHQSRRFQQLEAPGELAPSEQATFEAPVWPDVLPRPLLTGDYMVTDTQRENDGRFSRTPLPLPIPLPWGANRGRRRVPVLSLLLASILLRILLLERITGRASPLNCLLLPAVVTVEEQCMTSHSPRSLGCLKELWRKGSSGPSAACGFLYWLLSVCPEKRKQVIRTLPLPPRPSPSIPPF